MRISLALAVLVAALALPAGALALHGPGGTAVALPTQSQPAATPELVVPSVRAISPAYVTPVTPVPVSRATPPPAAAKPSGFDVGGAAIWAGVGICMLALAGGTVAVLRRRADHGVPAQA